MNLLTYNNKSSKEKNLNKNFCNFVLKLRRFDERVTETERELHILGPW